MSAPRIGDGVTSFVDVSGLPAIGALSVSESAPGAGPTVFGRPRGAPDSVARVERP